MLDVQGGPGFQLHHHHGWTLPWLHIGYTVRRIPEQVHHLQKLPIWPKYFCLRTQIIISLSRFGKIKLAVSQFSSLASIGPDCILAAA